MASTQPRILLTNDDGINADGLKILEKIANTLSKDVWVVAPEHEQSGAAHSLTLHSPVRMRKIDEKHYAVSGTPTDCVLLALQKIIPPRNKKEAKAKTEDSKFKRVDLILSGVNRGSNAADDVTYSGTIAGAMEGTIFHVPSIALSQLFDDRSKLRWDTVEKYAAPLIKKLVKAGWPDNTFININFPDVAPGKVKGVRICPQGKRLVTVALTERIDPKLRPYFWIGGDRENTPDRPGVDIDLLEKGYITVTPLDMDLTDYKTLEHLRKSCKFD